MKQKATLKNISKSLNLSISTVSRALKNHPDISATTKQKVTELATLLDYEPNAYAINLKTNRSKTIGLMVPVISPYFYHSFISAVEEEARKKDYSLFILQSGDDPAVELENLRLCRVNRVAGLFVAISSATKDIQPFLKLEELGIPVIFFDKVPNYEACNKVCLADEDAGKLAAETLLKKDPQHILAIFGNPDLLITQKRQRSFLDAIAASPKTIPVTVRYASSAEEAQHHCLESISFASKPDLIFTMSDEILTGVIKALYATNQRIPKEVGLLSISNDGFIPSLFDPRVSYVETSGASLGKLAMKRLLDYLNGKTFFQELRLPCRLVEGASL